MAPPLGNAKACCTAFCGRPWGEVLRVTGLVFSTLAPISLASASKGSPLVRRSTSLAAHGGDLLAPLLLDGIGLHLGLHRLVGLLLLGRDGQHIDPGIAAVAELGGVGLDAGRPRECRLRDPGRLGMLDRRLALAGLAVAVDLGNLTEGKLQAPADLLQGLAGRTLALHLFVQRLQSPG